MFIWRTRDWRATCTKCGKRYGYGDVQCENDGHNLVVCILPNGDPSSRLTNPHILLLRSETNSGPTYDGVFCKTRNCGVVIKGKFVKAKFPPVLRFKNAAQWTWKTTASLAVGLPGASLAATFWTFPYYMRLAIFWGVLFIFVLPSLVYFYCVHRPFRRWVSFRQANEGAPVSATMSRFS